MNHILKTQSYKNCTIELVSDPHPESPRTWDNVGTIACWHRRYILGDEQPKTCATEYLENLARAVVRDAYPESLFEKNLQNILNKHYVILPVYLYDHSGITIRTSPFSCPWDSGQVGIIYASLEDAKLHWPKLKGKTLRSTLTACLQGEIDTYDTYLQGGVIGWVTKDEEGNQIESVWGYYPDSSKPYSEEWCQPIEEAKASIEAYLEEKKTLDTFCTIP
jgi:hypothetical protein